MNNEQRERLEQELRFLKESLEADVISRDEYERGKERIEKKLEEVGERPEEEPKEEVIGEEKEIKEEPKIEIKEIREEKPRRIEEPEEEKEEKPREEEKPEEKEEVFGVGEKKEAEEEKEPEEEPEEEIKISKKWLYGIAILIIVVILFFSIRSCKPTEEGVEEEEIEEKPIEEFVPECSSNSDCKKEGMVGVCLNPGTKEAECEFKEDVKTELVVINDKDCKLCDSSSMKTIIKEIFPNVNINELDYGTSEAKRLITKLDINALPAYIFDSDVKETINFNDFKGALIKKGDNYIVTNTASGATYYFKRELIENRLDIYLLPGTTGKIEAHIQEVSDLFKDKINFTKHVVTAGQKEALKKELAINTYPTFLFNNQLKFGGILPADLIKEKICSVNYFEECSKELSKV